MASENDSTPETTQSIFERLINSRNREISLLLPFVVEFTATISDPDNTRVESLESTTNPDNISPNRSTRDESTQLETMIFINPVTQSITVIEGTGLDSLFRGKDGQPPASKSAVENLPRVEIREEDENEGECVICLEEYCVGNILKKMPCQHGFHEKCIEKWLGIHGSCPVCRSTLPVDQEEKKSEEREIWMRFSFGSGGGNGGDHDQTVENDSDRMGS